MPNKNVTLEDLAAGVALASGQSHRLVIKRIRAEFIELDELTFHVDSAVFAPLVSDLKFDSTKSQGGAVPKLGGLDVIACALRFAEANASKKLMVIGHTDSSGGSGGNDELSKRRADNVYRFLSGEREAWIESCTRDATKDRQLALRWAHKSAVKHYGRAREGDTDEAPLRVAVRDDQTREPDAVVA